MATLIAGGYVSGTEGDTITAANLGSTTVPGTLTPFTISTTYKATGPRSFRSNGATVFGYGNWTLASHNDEFAAIYFVLDGTPGGTGYPIEVRNGADSAFAYRIGFDTSRRMVITNATSITTTSTFALTNGVEYLFEVNAAGAGDLNVSIYDVATYTLQEALTPGALTATNFSKFRQGCAASVAGAGLSYHMDVVLSDTAFPARIVRGTSAVTLGAVTSAASGTVTVTGTSAVTLGAVTSAGTGTATVTGTSAVTLGAVTSAGTGTLTVTGTSAVTLGAMTLAGAGSVDSGVTGTSVVTLGAMTSTGDGFVIVAGDSAVTLGAMTSVGAGTVGVTPTGTSVVTLAPMTSAGAGTVTVIGTSAVTLGAMTSAGIGTLTVTGTSAVTLGAMTSAGTGTVTDAGSSAVSLAPMTSTGVGTVTVVGTSAVTLGPVTSSASGTLTVTGTSAVTLAPMTSVGVGYVTVPAAPDPDVINVLTKAAVHISTSARVDIVTCGDRVHIYDIADLHVTTRGAP